jgi:para-aminobenzoate synthetase / 4-amino-4-deoxychorismate lyase
MPSALSPDPAAGVFETLLILDGGPVELDAHLRRLSASVGELFDRPLPAGTAELVRERARSVALGRLRLTVAPASGGEPVAEVVVASVDRANVFPAWDRAVELRGVVVPGGLGAHKWADRAGLAALESDMGEGVLPLLLDSADEVLEASRANVFAVAGDVLVTPALDGRILPGVARARAIEAARSLGLEVREQKLTLERLAQAPEAFLTGSVRGVEPVRAVQDARLEGPGEAAREIAAAMKRLWIGRGAASWAAAL